MSLISSGFDVLIIVLGFGLLIFVHELGHFLAAKWAGIRAEAFAIGMGPVVGSFRRGVGFSLGSTERKVVAKTGKRAHELTDEELQRHGIDETEYSLRWLPIGGFVKMLGQEDANPNAVSDDPRSYGQCPIGKRMVVVSAGVIMNLILAAVLFVIAFMIGVPLTAAVVGDVVPTLPAARVVAKNAAMLGIQTPGLHPGDRVLEIDDKAARTFADVQIASAMARPGRALEFKVERPDVDEPLLFSIVPEKDPGSGLLSIGIAPASSTILVESGKGDDAVVRRILEETGLWAAGVRPGMRLITANGRSLETFEQLQRIIEGCGGEAVSTEWSALDASGKPVGAITTALLPVNPAFQLLIYPASEGERQQNFEQGLVGLTPLVKIRKVEPGPNAEVLQPGDIVLRIGTIDGPRMADFRAEIQAHRRETIDLQVLRDGEVRSVTAAVDRKGRLNVLPDWAWETPMIAQPMTAVRTTLGAGDAAPTTPTAVADLELVGRMTIDSVNGAPVADWVQLRARLREQTAAAFAQGVGTELELGMIHPTPDRDREEVVLRLSSDTVKALQELGWTSDLPSFAFQPIETIRSAGGNPVTAIWMGLQETHKLILLTYLTIDRLFRRSVGVEQLQGPLGIVHMGSKIIEGGFTYLIFFLAMISVNLAVINFLPIPIVDGGLFLFLIYEKIKGRPPSLAFQNAATIVGLCLIGTVFLVVTWNDVMRLLG